MSIKESVKSLTQLLGCILWLVLGLIQFFAIYYIVDEYVPIFLLNFIIAMLLAYTPILGTIIAIYCACSLWHWNIWLAILLFCPMYILIILNYILVFIVDKLKKEPTPEEIQRAYDELEEQLKDSEKE